MLLYSIIQIFSQINRFKLVGKSVSWRENLFCDVLFYYSSNLDPDWTRPSLVIAARVLFRSHDAEGTMV